MPSVHSKDSKKTDPKAILMSFFFGVANYVLLLPAELQMTQEILKGDLARTSRMLAVSTLFTLRTQTHHTHTNVDHWRCEWSLGILPESDIWKTFGSYR